MKWDWVYKIVMLILVAIPAVYIIYNAFFPAPVPSIDITLEESSTERLFNDVLKDLRINPDYSRISGLEIKGDSFLSKSNIMERIYPKERQYIKFQIKTIDHVKNPHLMIFLVNPHGIIKSEFSSSNIDITKIIEVTFEIPEKKSCIAYGRWQLVIVLLDELADGSKQLIGLFSYPIEVGATEIPTKWSEISEIIILITSFILLLMMFSIKTMKIINQLIRKKVGDLK